MDVDTLPGFQRVEGVLGMSLAASRTRPLKSNPAYMLEFQGIFGFRTSQLSVELSGLPIGSWHHGNLAAS